MPIRTVVRERVLPVVVLVLACAAVPAGLLIAIGRDGVSLTGRFHFDAVGVSAEIATLAALWLVGVGAWRRDGRVVVLGSAFALMAALLAVHGLSTPGVLVESNGVVALSGALTLPVGASLLALAAFPRLRGPGVVAPLLVVLLLSLVLIGAVCAIGLVFPGTIPAVPGPRSPAAFALLAFGLIAFGVLAARASRTYLLTRRITDLLVVVAVVLLAVALVAALTLTYRELGWWLGHAFEVIGIALAAGAVAYDLRRAAQSRPILGDLRGAEVVRAEEGFLGSHVRALTVRLGEKDEYTRDHTRRVALLAVEVGERLGLAASSLRALAIGGLLHDIGKLSVPDSILKKPGPLDDEEYEVVKRHARHGAALLAELGGFSEAVRRLVLSHHERLDGSGYPDGLREAELDLPMRILAVCDVYDALRSSRVYRDAWTHEAALAHLATNASRLYDARCVAALEQVLTQRPAPAQRRRPSLAERALAASPVTAVASPALDSSLGAEGG